MAAVAATDYRMIESLAVDNFRCFQHLGLRDLKRINVVVGRSGSGKTALLEAIYLAASGSPEVAFRLRRWRGFGPGLQFTNNKVSYESLWHDLFYAFDTTKAVSVSLIGS